VIDCVFNQVLSVAGSFGWGDWKWRTRRQTWHVVDVASAAAVANGSWTAVLSCPPAAAAARRRCRRRRWRQRD